MIYIDKINKQNSLSEQRLGFLNNFSNIDDAINFCEKQINFFSEKSNKLERLKENKTKVIQDKLKKRTLGDVEGFEHRSPNLATTVAMPVLAPLSAYNKTMVSHDDLTPYEKSEEADAILSHALRRAALGGFIGGALALATGSGLNGVIFPSVGALIGGGIGAYHGASSAKKRREELLRVLV